MKNLRYFGESYDTDKILSISLDNGTIIVELANGVRHSFNYSKDDTEDKARKDYDEFLKLYKIAVDKRRSGEEAKEREIEEKKRLEEIYRYYSKDENEDNFREQKKVDASTKPKKYSQEPLF